MRLALRLQQAVQNPIRGDSRLVPVSHLYEHESRESRPGGKTREIPVFLRGSDVDPMHSPKIRYSLSSQ